MNNSLEMVSVEKPRKFVDDMRNGKPWTFNELLDSDFALSLRATDLEIIDLIQNHFTNSSYALTIIDESAINQEIKRTADLIKNNVRVPDMFDFDLFFKIAQIRQKYYYNVLELRGDDNVLTYFALWTTNQKDIKKIEDIELISRQRIRKRIKEIEDLRK